MPFFHNLFVYLQTSPIESILSFICNVSDNDNFEEPWCELQIKSYNSHPPPPTRTTQLLFWEIMFTDLQILCLLFFVCPSATDYLHSQTMNSFFLFYLYSFISGFFSTMPQNKLLEFLKNRIICQRFQFRNIKT